MEYICPHCSERISYVQYIEHGFYQYGTMEIGSDNHDYDGMSDEGNRDYMYECPECNEGISDPDELKEAEEEEKEEEEKEDKYIKIKQPLIENTGAIAQPNHRYINENITEAQCKRCKEKYEVTAEYITNKKGKNQLRSKEEIECCNTTVIKYNQLIKS